MKTMFNDLKTTGKPGRKSDEFRLKAYQEVINNTEIHDPELQDIVEGFKKKIGDKFSKMKEIDTDFKNMEKLLYGIGIKTPHSMECFTDNDIDHVLHFNNIEGTGWRISITLQKGGEIIKRVGLISAPPAIKIQIKPYLIKFLKEIQRKFTALVEGMDNII
jgi:hypothetical protein